MIEIFSKLIVHKQTESAIDIELQLSDTSEESALERDFNKAVYNPCHDEETLEVISRAEFEDHASVGGATGILGDDEVIYATELKCCLPTNTDVPEVASYPQGKGKILQWLLLFEAASDDVNCMVEYYVFYRNSIGDICKLHPEENRVSIHISHERAEATPVTVTVSRLEKRALDCGRYYFAFRLRTSDGQYMDEPVVQYVNIVPAKSRSIQVESNLVGLDAIYNQMALLTKQKIFNDHRQAMNLTPTPINLHAAVMGGKGSGKTSFAHVLYDFYVQNGFITEGKLRIVNAAQWEKSYDNTSVISEAMSEASMGMLYIENAASMILTDMRGNKEQAVEELVRQLQSNTNDTCVVVADTPERITQLLSTAGLQSYIGQIYKLPTLTMEQMLEIAHRECSERGFVLTDGATKAMKSYLSSQPDVNTSDMTKLIDTMIANMSVRVVNNAQDLLLTQTELSELKAEDVPQRQIGRYTVSMGKLNELVGLKNLKYSIESHLSLVRFARLRSQNGLQATIPPLHMVFTGNPGTGKTTVATLLGEIYASLGILKTGQVIQVDRKKLVGQYIGDTEENTRRVLKQAHGNILFIDEAYNLVADPDDKKDYGPKVLDCLLEELSKESTDMIIILAGYPDEMEKMLSSNKGLQSRFPYTFHFEDYSEDELLEIAVRTARNSNYVFSDKALERLKGLIHREVERSSVREQKHFGNARFITRLISTQIIPNMSRRVLVSEETGPSSQLLSRIEAGDIPTNVNNTDYKIDEALVSKTLRQLNELIGCEDVKQTLQNLVSIARNKQQNGEDLTETIPLQWTFTGSTGTGKSSVAQLLAQLLHAFHLISSDRMTQLRMPQSQQNAWTSYDIDRILRDTMKQSGQGLLFIDLDDVANCHIDIQWLRCKLTSLTAEMPGSYAFVIAVDDYRLPMQLIDMPISTSVVHFADYSAEELLAILLQRLSKHGFWIADDAKQELEEHIRTLYDHRNNGLANARTMKHIYTAITSAAELRLIMPSLNDSISSVPSEKSDGSIEIRKEDIQSIKWKQIKTSKIGFES